MSDIFSNRFVRFFGTSMTDGDFASPKDPEQWSLHRERLLQCIRVKTDIAMEAIGVAQLVHGTKIQQVGLNRTELLSLETDGLVSAIPRSALVVTGADCPAVFVWDQGNQAMGLVHSGRKGTESNIVLVLLKEMRDRFGTKVEQASVCIGPGICGSHYAVPKDMAQSFLRFGSDVCMERDGKWYLDLRVTIRGQLIQAGVPRSRIQTSFECTFEATDRLHSYRRDRQMGILDEKARPRVTAYIAVMV